MAAVMFDTQKFVKRLQAAKFPPEQAEAQSDAMREVLESAFASHAKEQQGISTRAVNELDSKTEKVLVKLEGKVDKLEAKVENLVLGLRKDMENLDHRMTARFTLLQWMLGALITGMVGLLVRAFFYDLTLLFLSSSRVEI